jgi:hypothetical protein
MNVKKTEINFFLHFTALKKKNLSWSFENAEFIKGAVQKTV